MDVLEKVIFEKLLPPFDNIDAESHIVEEKEWNRLGELPGTGDEDPATLAEVAGDAGLAYYEAMMASRQTILNTMAAALYHLFEQQVIAFCRHELVGLNEVRTRTFNPREAIKRIKDKEYLGIDCEKFASWEKIQELRLVADTVKHADEGTSAKQLYARRPDMFVAPCIRGDAILSSRSEQYPIYMPLAGTDFYVIEDDLKHYCNTVREFWKEVLSPLFDAIRDFLQRP